MEYKLIVGNAETCEKTLRDWAGDYDLEVVTMSSGLQQIVILVKRTPKEPEREGVT